MTDSADRRLTLHVPDGLDVAITDHHVEGQTEYVEWVEQPADLQASFVTEYMLGDPITMAIYVHAAARKAEREAGRRCYWTPSGAAVHVKPWCRCGRRGPSWW